MKTFEEKERDKDHKDTVILFAVKKTAGGTSSKKPPDHHINGDTHASERPDA